jgi:two-component system CheB/CheR fusion protein
MAKALKKKSVAKKAGIKNKASKSAHDLGTIKPFPVVCIGGSAGGMEAFSEILENLQPSLGMAYIYVQHLSPDHQSLLPQILQRKSKMPVLTIKENMALQKNHVYVLPAKFHVTISNGRLKLHKPAKTDTVQSIDRLFTSVAPLYKQNAIGILLSGTGADGTLGLMAIKAEGGISFAQDNSAHFNGMPQHATEMGFVDFVMPPDRIAKELASLIRHPYSVTTANNFLLENKTELQKIHTLMHNKRGVDFSHYKQTTIHRRILRRMALSRLKSVEAYVQLLREKDAEIDALYHDLLITVTNFFRDPAMFTALTNKVLPALLKDRRSNDPLRIWIPCCATGEEAVSFAITLLEFLGDKALTIPVQIFATDLNERAIEKARAGTYLKTALLNVSAQRLRKFFLKSNDHYQVIKPIRDMCIFASHNLLRNPPFSRMDIISCQNLLIYLESAPQIKIMHSFHYALKSTGFLILGKSETIGHASSLFDQPYKQYKLYTRRNVNTPLQPDFSATNYNSLMTLPEINRDQSVINHKEPDLEKETDKLLLNRYTPASVLVNKDLDILRFRGSTSRYLEPSTGKASLNLLKMVRDDLVFDLRSVIHRAKKDNQSAYKEGIIFNSNGASQEIAIEVIPVKGNGTESYYLIIFNDRRVAPTATTKENKPLPKASDAEKKISKLETQLHEARENFKILTEDFEATREELQSANEEVLSSNEELQSINEELETSKEELQSTNEELTTINEELQIRNNELKEAGDYARAVIETMHESLLMLTDDLRVKNANKGFYQTFNSTPEETEGMFLYDLGNRQWDIPELRKRLTMVQTRDVPIRNFEVNHEFPGIGWKSMLVNAHKFPLREGNNSLILLAVQDITDRKQMEETLKDNEERFRLLIQNASDIITVFDREGTIKYESSAIETVLGYSPSERIGRNISMDSMVHPDDRDLRLGLLKAAIERPGENISGEFRMLHKDGGYRTIDAIFRNLLDHKKINGILANYRDVTDRKMFELQKDEFIGIASHELKTPVTSIKAYVQLLESMFIEAEDSKSAQLLSKMNTQVDRLTALIVDLLDFTRIEGGHLKFKKETYSLNELVSEVVEENQRINTQQPIERKLAKDVFLTGDRFRTGQVLTNLVSNAMKYSGKNKKVIVKTKVNKQDVIVSVEDSGIGIEPKLLDRVFDRFFRITQTSLNTYPGLGLGLYIAAEFIKRQGGKIWATSAKNKGSTFFFSLPLNP